MAKDYFIADTHFGPDAIIRYENRPFKDTKEQEECLIKNWNDVVNQEDTVYVIGDFGMSDSKEETERLCRLLNGNKILVMGNHDSGATNYKRKIEVEEFAVDKYQKHEAIEEMRRRHPGCKYSVQSCWMFTEPFECWEVTADNCLFDEVYEGPLFIGEKLLLSHEPIDFPFALNLHGHDHSGQMKNARAENFCSNVIDFTPVNLNQFLKAGPTSKINTIHRSIINEATKRKHRRMNNGK